MALVPGYHAYFSFSKTKLGYSGVVAYVRESLPQPIQIHETIVDDMEHYTLNTPAEKLDAEGRSILLDFGYFILLNIYFPNDAGEVRIEFKMDFHRAVQNRIERELKHKHVILVGDINAVHEEIDHCDPKQSIKDHDLEDFKDLPQRRWLDNMIDPKGPLVDMTRLYHPGRQKMFTCWNTRMNARPINFGTRIDYVLPSIGLSDYFRFADIQPHLMGSDHCPVYADFSDELRDKMTSEQRYLNSTLLASNFPEFKHQNKLSNYFRKRPLEEQSTQETSEKIQKTSQKKKTTAAMIDNYFIKKPSTVIEKDVSPIISNNQATKATWTSIFQTPEIPRCTYHNEPCLERTVTKKGPNFGRVFYVCSKPRLQHGPSEDQLSCNFFLWKQNKGRK
ncbi:Endonuclease/exonuclease/phosphatase [Gilbertella persicaria]|nr:Endonuclease/exonuclease/phosphatase [Gilbertella persicaria]KAI8091435.1 Endonuclease/exonuclease/phosphatase [Gilbertella persicaria]